MRFIDEAKVKVIGGKGGAGFVGWRREAHVPRGGPDGGDGGNGGAVVFVAEPGLNTLLDFHYNPLLRAEDGQGGGIKQLSGRNGQDLIIKVPVGTQVFKEEKLIADLALPQACWIAARGGHGGKGNMFFKSSTNQAPDYAQEGQQGEEFSFKLVLKSVADVGLVGYPNVGKSTLIAAVSKATPRVADYPFTTLQPHLGVAELDEKRRFVIADIPGLIPGAHEGKGLGIQFLKHIERTKVLAQLIDVSQPSLACKDPLGAKLSDSQLEEIVLTQFSAIDHELRAFSPELAAQPRLLAFSKGDLPLSQRAYEVCKNKLSARGYDVFLISANTHKGLSPFLSALYQLVGQVLPS